MLKSPDFPKNTSAEFIKNNPDATKKPTKTNSLGTPLQPLSIPKKLQLFTKGNEDFSMGLPQAEIWIFLVLQNENFQRL